MHIFTTDELRLIKPEREAFRAARRHPVQLLLDGVQRNYNLGAIFRLCDALLIERVIVTGVNLLMHKRKFMQAAQGAQHWVPWVQAESAEQAVIQLKRDNVRIVVAELTTSSVAPEHYHAVYPLCLVVGNERAGVSQAVADLADASIAIPMQSMANSLNVATATAIILYQLIQPLLIQVSENNEQI